MPEAPIPASHERHPIRFVALVVLVVAALLWIGFQFVRPLPPRHIVIASGADFGLYHRYAQRYKAILARNGITVEERLTAGAGENLQLLLDPGSRVDVAFMQGGVAAPADDLVMLSSLYYEPLWVFYRGGETWTNLGELRGHRIATGLPGSGTRALVEPLLAANGVTSANTSLAGVDGVDAIGLLRKNDIDAALLVGGSETPIIESALRDPTLKLMSFARADAYPRRFRFISHLTLPAGTIDLGAGIPSGKVDMIGTKSMLVARASLHPALINLLVDAAREIHGGQGAFETAGEFPSTAPVDLKVSESAVEHIRYGPGFIHRYLPFWAATLVERAIVLLLPLVVVLVPAFNVLPEVMRWRARSRIYRWYGELALLERDVENRAPPLPVAQWMRDLDRIELSVGRMHTPPSFASEAYTLREHVDLVRREILAKAAASAPVSAKGAALREDVSQAGTAVRPAVSDSGTPGMPDRG
jgi:TRAP-type uncharacterized transport system substrate-binding protein